MIFLQAVFYSFDDLSRSRFKSVFWEPSDIPRSFYKEQKLN